MYRQPVVVVEDGDDFAFTLTRHEESVLVRLPASRVPTQPMLALVGMFIASLIASASVAYLLARRLTQPLRDAALTAYRVGRRELPQLNNPDGADELIELTTSFNRMAREVDALVNNRTMLLAGVSHDLRSPLARLRLAIELARDTRDWQLLDAMQSYVDTLASLLDDYLDFAQGAAGAARSLVALDRECRALAEEFAPRVRVTGEPVFVEVNHVGLLRILRNTIENALRYGGTGRVEIDWVVVAGQVEIRIADRGPGFARAPAELLQPFARGERSRNARTGGLGLGLAVCNMIAQAQGWTFNIENRPGGGARARLTVPHAPR
jgi:two-component system osmolarity sensor histidine kinase EnvZ